MERQELRLKVWEAMHDYYWDRAKLHAWYMRLVRGDRDIEDIEEGMKQYPDLSSIRIKGA